MSPTKSRALFFATDAQILGASFYHIAYIIFLCNSLNDITCCGIKVTIVGMM